MLGMGCLLQEGDDLPRSETPGQGEPELGGGLLHVPGRVGRHEVLLAGGATGRGTLPQIDAHAEDLIGQELNGPAVHVGGDGEGVAHGVTG